MDANDSNNWATLQDATSLFSSNLWEPGHTEFVTLKIENKGTLAFNYKMMVTPVKENGGINVAGDAFKLSNYLSFGTTKATETQTVYSTRADARNAITDTRDMSEASLATMTQANKILAGGNAQYVTLVVYMPEEVGNEANYRGTAPTIDLGIQVLATQLTSESDSFDNKYDEDAVKAEEYAGVGPYYEYFEAVVEEGESNSTSGKFEIKKEENGMLIASASGTAANPGDTVTLTVTKSKEAETSFTTAVQDGYELNGYDINVVGHTPGSVVQMQLFVGIGLQDFKFYHDGTAMTSVNEEALPADKTLEDGKYYYDAPNGYVYFATSSFSPFQATYKATEAAIETTTYGTLAAAIANAKDGDTITLTTDITAEKYLVIPEGKTLTIDGKGHTYSFSGYNAFQGHANIAQMGTNTNLTIKNTKFVSLTEGTGYVAVTGFESTNSSITLDKCTFVDLWGAVYANNISKGASTGTVTIQNCVYEKCKWLYSDENKYYNNNKTADGYFTFNFTDNKYPAGMTEEYWGDVVIQNGIQARGYSTLEAALNGAQDNEIITLPDGEHSMTNVSGKNITITGSKDAKLTLGKGVNGSGSTITFDGITIQGYAPSNSNDWYTEQLKHAQKLTYKNCDIIDLITTYAPSDFENCVFTNNSSDDKWYSVFVYGVNCNITDCTFNAKGSKAIKLFDEGVSQSVTLNVTDCVFNGSTSNKAAVEIDSTRTTMYYVNITNCTTNEVYTKLWQDDSTKSVVKVDGVEQSNGVTAAE